MSEEAPQATTETTTPAAVEAPATVDPANPYGRQAPPIIGDGYTFSKDWVEHLPNEDFDRHRTTLQKFAGKTVLDLAKSYGELEKHSSAKAEGMVKVPKPDATPEEISAFRRAVGIPESADAYQISIPESLPEGLDFDPAPLEPLKEIFAKHGGTQALLNEILDFQAKYDSVEVARLTQEALDRAKAGEEQLRKEWGNNWEKNLALAERVKLTGGGLPEDHWGHHDPHIQRLLASLGSKLSEGSMSAHGAAVANLGPGNAARDMFFNPDNPNYKAIHDSSHPDHERAYSEYLKMIAEQHRKD